MKIKEGFILRKIVNEDMVIPIGNNIADFNGVLTLNESAAFLWKLLQVDHDLLQLVEALRTEFDLEQEIALTDTQNFVMQLQQADLFVEIEGEKSEINE